MENTPGKLTTASPVHRSGSSRARKASMMQQKAAPCKGGGFLLFTTSTRQTATQLQTFLNKRVFVVFQRVMHFQTLP